MPDRPNILFCLADDAGLHMGALGCPWVRTPAFDRVAREGVLFTNAYTPNAKCGPSRACIITGRNSWQLEEAGNHIAYFPRKFTSVWEALKAHGYHAGYTAKGWSPGDPGTINGQPRELTGGDYSDIRCAPPTREMCDVDYAENFRAFLRDRPDGAPFIFWYGSKEPHRAYEYGSGVEKGGKRPADIDRVYGIWPDNDVVRNDLLDYGYAIEYFDRHTQRMLDILDEAGELENTLVVVTSDNGLPFPRAKGQEYEYSNHLPLAIMWPKGIRAPGRTVEDFVSFIDFAPTFLEIAGVGEAASGMQPIEGRSLTDILFSDRGGRCNPERDHVLIGKERHDVGRPGETGYPIRGIYKGGWMYLRNFEPERWPSGDPEAGCPNCDAGPTKTECIKARDNPAMRTYWEWSFGKRPAEELYHIAEDPDCIENLADSPGHAAMKEELSGQLMRELEAQNDPRMFGRGEVFDGYPIARKSLLDFYERFVARRKA